MHNINIEGVNNGWIVTVGCTRLVCEDKTTMLSEIGRYIADPEFVEMEYRANAKNKPRVTIPPTGTIAPMAGLTDTGAERGLLPPLNQPC